MSYAFENEESGDLLQSSDDSDKPKGVFRNYLKPCLVELIATTIFVCLGCLVVQDPLGANIPLPSAVAVALCHGVLATCLITAFAKTSGGHFNPAVTLAMTACKAISPGLAAGYVICQMIGSIIGGYLCLAMLPMDTYKDIEGGAHILTAVDPGTGILCEMILTATVVITALHAFVNDEGKNHHMGALAIGMAITAGLLAGIEVTGGSMNPVRSFGPAVALSHFNNDAWNYHYVYWAGPFLGSILATLIFKLCSANADKRWF